MTISVAQSPVELGWGASYSKSVTVSSGNYLLVLAHFPAGAAVTNVKWNGVSMDTITYLSATSGCPSSAAYGLKNFDLGLHTFSADCNLNAFYTLGSLSGVGGVANATTPIGFELPGSATWWSRTVTTSPNHLTFSYIAVIGYGLQTGYNGTLWQQVGGYTYPSSTRFIQTSASSTSETFNQAITYPLGDGVWGTHCTWSFSPLAPSTMIWSSE